MAHRTSWSVFGVAFSAGVAVTVIQFSVPPIMAVLQTEYNATYSQSGLLMSLFALATLMSAIPGGMLIQRYGERSVGLLGLIVILAGLAIVYYASQFPLLLVGRIIQGIGFGIVSVAAPSAIGKFTAPEQMSVAMGIWSTWVPVGSLIMFLAAPSLVLALQMDTFWLLLMALIVLESVLYAIWIPKSARGKPDTAHVSKGWVKQELKNGHAWWIAGAFASFTFAFFSFNTWISAYLVQSGVLPLVQASWIPAIVALFTAVSNMGSGWLLAKFGNKLIIFLLPTLIMTLIWPVFLEHRLALMYVSAVLLGAVSGFVPTFVFAAGPLYARRKETIGIVMSIVILGENAGILVGPEVFGFLRDATGQFTASFWILSAASLFSVIASIRIRKTGVFLTNRNLNGNVNNGELKTSG